VAAYLDSTGEEPAERVAIGEQLVALYRVRESLTQRLNPNAAPDIRKAPAALIKSLERELSNLPGPSHQRAAEIKAAIKGARGVVAELESELKRVEKQIAGLEAKSAELADVRRIPEHFKLSPPRATKS
jgi:chromosome segregation ATPase